MSHQILVFYGSYRSDRMGIRLAEFVVERFRRRGDAVELIDAKAINLPMLDRMYKEPPPGKAPEQLERLAGKIRDADDFVFVTHARSRHADRLTLLPDHTDKLGSPVSPDNANSPSHAAPSS
jgi:hypothetical protein